MQPKGLVRCNKCGATTIPPIMSGLTPSLKLFLYNVTSLRYTRYKFKATIATHQSFESQSMKHSLIAKLLYKLIASHNLFSCTLYFFSKPALDILGLRRELKWSLFYNYVLIKFLYSSSSNISFSIDNIVNPFNLSWDIVDLRYDFINFNFKKCLSAKAIVTCIDRKSTRWTPVTS